MKRKSPAPTGEREQGEVEPNRPHYTSLRFRLQAVDAFFLPLLFIVDRVVGEVCR